MSELPRMYTEFANWWPLLSAPADYAEEGAFYAAQLIAVCDRVPETVLELGSGGGNNAWHMKQHFRLTLVDQSPAMLLVSQALNPDLEHVQGDMRTVRLDREFDGVFIHDAVVYMTNEADVRRAIETARVHCRVGGAVVIAPDHVRETFHPTTDHGGHDGEDRALRYLEWTWDPDPSDDTCIVDYTYTLRDRNGSISIEHDRHVEGIFSRERWLTWLTEAGFDARAIPFDHSELEPGTYEVFRAKRIR